MSISHWFSTCLRMVVRSSSGSTRGSKCRQLFSNSRGLSSQNIWERQHPRSENQKSVPPTLHGPEPHHYRRFTISHHIRYHLWTRNRPVAETSTWQHTTLSVDRHPCPPTGLEPAIPASEQPLTHASDRSPTGIGDDGDYWVYFYIIVLLLSKYSSRPFPLSHTAPAVGAAYTKGICKQVLTVYNSPPGSEMRWCTDCARYVEVTLSEPLWLHCPPILNTLKMKVCVCVYIYIYIWDLNVPIYGDVVLFTT